MASREEEGRRLCRTTQEAAEDNIRHVPTFTANRAAINIALVLIGERYTWHPAWWLDDGFINILAAEIEATP